MSLNAFVKEFSHNFFVGNQAVESNSKVANAYTNLRFLRQKAYFETNPL